MGFAIGLVLTKMTPRASVAKYLAPVLPGTTGSALAKYELAGVPADALQVPLAGGTSTTPAVASLASVTR
jgi:hypothetical protein